MNDRRAEQAYNDGRNAYREGKDLTACRRKSPDQRAQWLDGYEHERRLDVAERATDEQRGEAATVAKRLKDWAQTL